jgi:hypothetical protein
LYRKTKDFIGKEEAGIRSGLCLGIGTSVTFQGSVELQAY